MRVSQEVKLVRGAELCKLSLIVGDLDTVHLVMSQALQLPVRQMSQNSRTIQWEGSTRIRLPVDRDLSQRVIESLVALKVRTGFHVCQHFSVLPDQEPVLALVYDTTLGLASYPRPQAAQTLLPGNTTSQPATLMHMEDNVTFGDPAKVQKERKGGTSIYQLAQYFHHPINEAAKLLDICPTVLKKICRRHGLRRWPHRKLKSIQKSIDRLEASCIDLQQEPGKEHQLLSVSTKLMELKQERAVLCFTSGAGVLDDNIDDNDDD